MMESFNNDGVLHSQSPDQGGLLRVTGVRRFRIRRGHHEAGRVRRRRRQRRRGGGGILAAQRLQKGINLEVSMLLMNDYISLFDRINHSEVFHFSLDKYFWTTPFGTGLG